MKQQRRFFLKMLAAGPLVGCGGAASEGSLSGGDGGRAAEPGSGAGGSLGNAGSGAGGRAGSPPASGGGSFVSGGRFGDTGSPGGGASGGASAGAPGAGATGGGAVAGPGTPVGNVSSFPLGSLTIVEGIFFLGRDADGIYVMSMQCTHKGCVVALATGELKCTCHESRFDNEGNVLQGPATTPLPHFAVFVDAAGNISVDRYTVVSGSTRAAV